MADVKISDEYFTGAGKAIVDICDEAEKLLREYITVLQLVEEKGLISGDTHNAMVSFRETVETFKTEFQTQADAIKITNKLLIEDCDSFDRDLY